MKLVFLVSILGLTRAGVVHLGPTALSSMAQASAGFGKKSDGLRAAKPNLERFLADFSENVAKSGSKEIKPHAERSLYFANECQQNFDRFSNPAQQTLAVAVDQINLLATEYDDIFPNLPKGRLKREIGYLSVQMATLDEINKKKAKLDSLGQSPKEQSQLDAWYYQEALKQSALINQKARTIMLAARRYITNFLSVKSVQEAAVSLEFNSNVRALQTTRFLRKIVTIFSSGILNLSKYLATSHAPFDRKLLQIFRDKTDKEAMIVGGLTLGGTILLNKLARSRKEIKHLQKEFTHRISLIAKMGDQNATLFDFARKMRACTNKVDNLAYQLKRKIQNELDVPY